MNTTEHYTALQTVEAIKVEDKKFAIYSNDRIFYIGELLFDIVVNIKKGITIEQVRQNILDKYSICLSTVEISQIIQDKVVSNLAGESKVPSQLASYINGKAKLLSEETTIKLAKSFKWFFYNPLFIALLTISLAASGYYASQIDVRGIFGQRVLSSDSIIIIIINYLFLASVSLFHEIGHAAAASRYGINSKEIGFGFYLIFPVLYTDISKIWLLNRYKRLVVNIGGIYFQAILNLLIIGILKLLHIKGIYTYDAIMQSLFVTNSFLALYSLNPFLRNDGYWMYSDLFDIANLSTTAITYPRQFLSYFNRKTFTLLSFVKSIKRDLPLIAYSTASYVGVILLPFWLIKISRENYYQLSLIIEAHPSGGYDFDSFLSIAKIVILSLVSLYVLYRTAQFLVISFTHVGTNGR